MWALVGGQKPGRTETQTTLWYQSYVLNYLYIYNKFCIFNFFNISKILKVFYMIIQFTLLYSFLFLRSDNATLRAGVTRVTFPNDIIMKSMSQGFSVLYIEIYKKGYLGVHIVNKILIPIPQVS